MNKANRTLVALVLVAAPAVFEACTPRQGVYVVPEKALFHEINKNKVTPGVIINGFNNLVALELLDPVYMRQSSPIRYAIEPYEEDIAASYRDGLTVIHEFKKLDSKLKGLSIGLADIVTNYLLHERAHDFFKKMPAEKKQSFRAAIKELEKQYRLVYEEIKQHPEKLEKLVTGSIFDDLVSDDPVYLQFRIPLEILAKHGFNKDSFLTFHLFMAKAPIYVKLYGAKFDEMFYATEALAQIASIAFMGETLGVKMKYDLSKVPESVRPFYRSFLHPKFFE